MLERCAVLAGLCASPQSFVRTTSGHWRKENAKLAAENKLLLKEKVNRVSGSLRIETLANYADMFTVRAEDILGQVSDAKYKEVFDIVCTAKSKTSTDLKDKTKKQYAQGVKKKRKITKSEQNQTGLLITPELQGSLKTKFLTKRYEKAVDAEILHRGLMIPHPDREDRKEVKATKGHLKKTSITIKKRCLMDDELGLHAKRFKRKGVGYNLSDIKSIKAQSEEMKKLIGEIDQL